MSKLFILLIILMFLYFGIQLGVQFTKYIVKRKSERKMQ